MFCISSHLSNVLSTYLSIMYVSEYYQWPSKRSQKIIRDSWWIREKARSGFVNGFEVCQKRFWSSSRWLTSANEKKKNLSHFLDKTQGWERKESNISNIFSHGHPNLIRREGLKRGMSQISDQRNSLMVMASEEREGYVIFWHTSAHSSLQNSFVCNQFFIRFLIIQQMKDLYQLAGFG